MGVDYAVVLLQKIEKLTAMLHSLSNQPSNRKVYFAEDRFDHLYSLIVVFSFSMDTVSIAGKLKLFPFLHLFVVYTSISF